MDATDSPAAHAPASEPEVAGTSLWRDAFRRLLRNKAAVVGGVVTILIGVMAMTAEWLVPIDPTYQQKTAAAMGPMSSHLLINDDLVLLPGKTTDYPPPRRRKSGTRKFQLELEPVKGIELEVRVLVHVRTRTIRQIQQIGGGKPPEVVDKVAVAAPAHLEYRPDSGEPVRFDGLELTSGGTLPEHLVEYLGRASRGRALLLLTRTEPAPPQTLTFTVGPDQVVSDLLLDGKLPTTTVENEEIPGIVIDGKRVTNVLRDGEQLRIRHWLGTDLQGRDLLARVIFGGKISVLIGVVATLVSLIIGVLYGAVAGYMGGLVDSLMMRVVDILYGIPYMFLVIILMVAFGRDVLVLFIALGAVQWLTMARIIRGQVLSLKEKEYIEAARAAGANHWWIISRHLIPNTLGVIAVYTSLTIPAVILQESFLAFIGLGVEWQGLPLESWGSLTSNGVNALNRETGDNWWMLVCPAFALGVTLFSLNFLGDGLRDAFDPQMKGRS